MTAYFNQKVAKFAETLESVDPRDLATLANECDSYIRAAFKATQRVRPGSNDLNGSQASHEADR